MILPSDLNLSDGNFKELDHQIISEIEQIEKEHKNKKTSNNTKNFVDKFKEFLSKQNLPTEIDPIPPRYLNQYLRFWYAKATKCDGVPCTLYTLYIKCSYR